MKSQLMKTNGRTLMNTALCTALALAAIGSSAIAPASAQSFPSGPILHCYISPNDQPMPPGNLGRCASFSPGHSSYRADFEIRNLPAGSYTYAWTSEMGMVLPCNTSRCSVTYRGNMAVSDIVNVTYTNQATGAANTLSRSVQINGPL